MLPNYMIVKVPGSCQAKNAKKLKSLYQLNLERKQAIDSLHTTKHHQTITEDSLLQQDDDPMQ